MDSATQRHHIERCLFRTVSALTRALGMRDSYTTAHQSGVAELSRYIGQEMGLGSSRIDGLRLGATMHDIGKIGIPLDILSKPTRLAPEEKALVQRHPQLGAEILGDIKAPWPITEMVLQHHERLDGGGYPHGLKGDEIILEAQIIAVADTTEAMLVDRNYRKSLGIDAVIETLAEHRGWALNADAVDIVIRVLEARGRGSDIIGTSADTMPSLHAVFANV